MTENVDLMKEIVSSIAPELKAAGFTKRRFSFNRRTADGLTHVVWFWMGAFDPSGLATAGGFLPDYHGTFTIRVGVHVPAMTRMGTPRSTWINEYDCQLRWTVPELLGLNEDDDVWWQLRSPLARTLARDLTVDYALPHLDEFPSADAVLDRFEKDGPVGVGMNHTAALDLSEIFRARSDVESERRFLRNYVDTIIGRQPLHFGHLTHVSEYLVAQGHPDLATLIDSTIAAG